jgi:hypothetical protein
MALAGIKRNTSKVIAAWNRGSRGAGRKMGFDVQVFRYGAAYRAIACVRGKSNSNRRCVDTMGARTPTKAIAAGLKMLAEKISGR